MQRDRYNFLSLLGHWSKNGPRAKEWSMLTIARARLGYVMGVMGVLTFATAVRIDCRTDHINTVWMSGDMARFLACELSQACSVDVGIFHHEQMTKYRTLWNAAVKCVFRSQSKTVLAISSTPFESISI